MILFRQYARSERKTLLGMAVAIALLVLFSVWIFVLFKASGALDQLDQMMAEMPAALQVIFSKEASMTVLQGWLVNQFWRTEFVLVITAFTSIATVAVLTKEADHGTLSFLLSLPVSRTQVLLQRFAGLLTGLALLHAVVAVMMPVSASLFGFPADWSVAILLSLHSFLAQAAIAAILLVITTFFDETPIATAIALVLGLGALILPLLLKEDGWQGSVVRISPFHYYRPDLVMKAGALPGTETAVQLGIILVGTALALYLFNRKQVSG